MQSLKNYPAGVIQGALLFQHAYTTSSNLEKVRLPTASVWIATLLSNQIWLEPSFGFHWNLGINLSRIIGCRALRSLLQILWDTVPLRLRELATSTFAGSKPDLPRCLEDKNLDKTSLLKSLHSWLLTVSFWVNCFHFRPISQSVQFMMAFATCVFEYHGICICFPNKVRVYSPCNPDGA